MLVNNICNEDELDNVQNIEGDETCVICREYGKNKE